MGSIIIPIVQITKLGLRDGDELAQGYITREYLFPTETTSSSKKGPWSGTCRVSLACCLITGAQYMFVEIKMKLSKLFSSQGQLRYPSATIFFR